MKAGQLRFLFMGGSLIILFNSLSIALNLGSNDFSSSQFTLEFDAPPTNRNTCPENMIYLQDVIRPTNNSISIPTQIHIVIKNRCVPHEVREHFEKWNYEGHHSLLFYDDDDANSLLSQHRPAFPQLNQLAKCFIKSSLKTEIVKLLLLWDRGGIITDENIVPSDAKLWNQYIIQADDEGVFIATSDSSNPYSTDYMATIPKHPILYTLIQKTVADSFMQITDERYLPSPAERKSGYFDFVLKYIFSNITDYHPTRSRHEGMGASIALVNISSYQSNCKLMNASLSQPIEQLSISTPHESCAKHWERLTKKENSLSSLEKIVESKQIQCPTNQSIIHDTINPQSWKSGRKIPKVIHMTSKTRCVPEAFAKNIDTWRFNDYSLFLHDDSAMARLFQKEWTEFPLLHDVLNCITSGAGFADLWRYLVLWEYGGIYTDIDNAPGPLFNNGDIIEDHFDSFLEIEAARIPSQYFIAASPKHPVMYMAVQNTIQRLFNEQNIVKQYVPYVTGPGSMKWGVHYAIGNAYLSPGTYPTFDESRTLTIVGNKTSAMRRYFIKRGAISTADHYDSMNMTHYHWAGRQKGLPLKSCLEVLYDMSMHGKYTDLLGLNRL